MGTMCTHSFYGAIGEVAAPDVPHGEISAGGRICLLRKTKGDFGEGATF